MALTATFNTAEAFNMEGTSDNGGTWTTIGTASSLTANGDVFKVGSGSISVKLDASTTTRGGMQITRSATIDFDDAGTTRGLIAFWANSTSVLTDVTDTGGFTIRIGSDASNYYEYQVAKLNATSEIPFYEGGWQRYVVDLEDPPDATVGTPADASIDYFAIQMDTSTNIMGNIQVFFIDEMNFLTAAQMAAEDEAVRIHGSVVTAGALWTEIAAITTVLDEGIVTNLGGAFQLTQPIKLGDTGTGSDTLTSTNETIIIPKCRVVDGNIFIEFAGNSTGTNTHTWGTEVGSGDTSLGVGGGLIKTAGLANFKIIATDTNAIVNFFGVTIDGAKGEGTESGIIWDQTNAQMTSCTVINSSVIDHANGGEIRDSFIAASVEAAGIGAILIEDDPTGVEFRDMQLINNVDAIENERNGPVDLTLRNCKFSGNTADILHAGTGVLTVKNLETSDATTSSSTGGGSVVFETTVNLTITVVEGDFTTVNPGSRVGIHLRISPFTQFMNEETDVSGIATETHNYTGDLSVFVRVRDELFDYKIVPATITSTGLTLTVAAEDDDTYTAT